MTDGRTEPKGELAIRTQAMPKDTNPSGDIFGGRLMAQMDVAGGVTAPVRAKGRVARVAIKAMTVHSPDQVGCTFGCDNKTVTRHTNSHNLFF